LKVTDRAPTLCVRRVFEPLGATTAAPTSRPKSPFVRHAAVVSSATAGQVPNGLEPSL
jgi:hypothetical protein